MKRICLALLFLYVVPMQALVVPARSFSFRNDTHGVVKMQTVDMRTNKVVGTSDLRPGQSTGGKLQGTNVRIVYPNGKVSGSYGEGYFVVTQDGNNYSIDDEDFDL